MALRKESLAFNGKDAGQDKHTGFTFNGKEIILSKTRGRPFTGLVKKGMERGIYPEEKRIEAVALYAATGNFQRVEELSGVPVQSLKNWRKQEWFRELLREIREENNEKIDAKFTEIIEGALEQLGDRIANGDWVVTARGQLVRKPVNAKDLSLVGAINIDKRQLLRGEATSRSETIGDKSTEKQVNRLEKLAETFENLARFGRKPKTIEGEVVDAIQVESSESMDVRKQAEDGETVATRYPEGEEVTTESDEEEIIDDGQRIEAPTA
jgi:transposase-like protein